MSYGKRGGARKIRAREKAWEEATRRRVPLGVKDKTRNTKDNKGKGGTIYA